MHRGELAAKTGFKEEHAAQQMHQSRILAATQAHDRHHRIIVTSDMSETPVFSQTAKANTIGINSWTAICL